MKRALVLILMSLGTSFAATSPTFAVDRLPFELDDANGQAVDRERGAR